MRHGAGKNDNVPVGNHTLLKGSVHLSSPCVGTVPLCPATNGDAWNVMMPGLRVPSAMNGQAVSPMVTYDTNNQLLRNMIAQDVNLVSNTGVQKYVNHSRKKTRVASLPDGTVQITFRRMVPADQTKQGRPSHQIPILPKSIITDLNLCPLSSSNTQKPTEARNGAVPSSPSSSTHPIRTYTSTFRGVPLASPVSNSTSSTNVTLSQPACQPSPVVSLPATLPSPDVNGFLHASNSPDTVCNSVSANGTTLMNNNISSSNRHSTGSSSGAGIASDGTQWNHKSMGLLLNGGTTDKSYVSTGSSGVLSPPLEMQIASSNLSNSSVAVTSLEEELNRDLLEMCPPLFSPSTMDVDHYHDSNDYLPRSPLSELFDYGNNLGPSPLLSFPADDRPQQTWPSAVTTTEPPVPYNISLANGLHQPLSDSISLNPEPPHKSSTQNITLSGSMARDGFGFFCKDDPLVQHIDEATPHQLPTTPESGISTCHSSLSLCKIVDISPEISSTLGGGKIIVIGAWDDTESSYSCFFGDVEVPAELVQHGVLRCFCPAHPAGKVDLHVCKDKVAVSKTAVFEYLEAELENDGARIDLHQWLSIDEDDLKKLLKERFGSLLRILDPLGTTYDLEPLNTENVDLESVLCKVCEGLSRTAFSFHGIPHVENRMTLLHLAAALGYTQLIQSLCSWTDSSKSNSIISQEADPTKRDQFNWIPLFWACSKGRFDTVCVLLQWSEASLRLKDRCGCSPLSIAKDQNHTMLLRYLEKFHDRSVSRERGRKGFGNLSSLRMFGSPGAQSPMSCQMAEITQNEDIQWESASALAEATLPSSRLSDSFNLRSCDGSVSSSRTLAKTLAQVQAIIQDTKGDPDRSNPGSPSEYVTSDDESLFDVPPFTPSRSRNAVEDSRGPNVSTPLSSVSSLSPGSPNQAAHSPFDPSSHDTAEFCEFFYNSKEILEKDFAELTLTDQEQQELYRAASIIQKAYKAYRERRKRRDHELQAATLIQSYYRRYKQYASFKKMQKGALLIQSQFRAHREERKKSKAASVIQTYYRRYRERKDSNGNIQERNRAQQDADRRANRFMRQNSSRLRDFPADFTTK